MKLKKLVLILFISINWLSSAVCTEIIPDQLCEATTDIEKLTLLQTKYGNNPYGVSTLQYAILQNDEAAVDLLLKYGASPFVAEEFPRGSNCLTFAVMQVMLS